MMSKKYELLKDDSINTPTGETLYRIRALRDVKSQGWPGDNGEAPVARAGDIGGYIQSEQNLSQDGGCWVMQEAKVFHRAQVIDDALVVHNAMVFDNALISENALVANRAFVYGYAVLGGRTNVIGNSTVCEFAEIYGEAVITGNADVGGHAQVRGDKAFIGEHASIAGRVLVNGSARILGHSRLHGSEIVTGSLMHGNRVINRTQETHIESDRPEPDEEVQGGEKNQPRYAQRM